MKYSCIFALTYLSLFSISFIVNGATNTPETSQNTTSIISKKISTVQPDSSNMKYSNKVADTIDNKSDNSKSDRNIQSIIDRNAETIQTLGDNDYYNPWAYIYPEDTLLTVLTLKAYQIRLYEIKAFYDVLYARKNAEKAEEKAKKDLERAKELANNLLVDANNMIKAAEDSAELLQSNLNDDIKGKLIEMKAQAYVSQTYYAKPSFAEHYEAKLDLKETARLSNWKDPTRFPPQHIRVKPYKLKETVDVLSKYFEYKDLAKFWRRPK
jgi:hypothetical protein